MRTVWLVYNTDPKYMDSFLVAIFSNGQAARAFIAEQRECMTIDTRAMHDSWPYELNKPEGIEMRRASIYTEHAITTQGSTQTERCACHKCLKIIPEQEAWYCGDSTRCYCHLCFLDQCLLHVGKAFDAVEKAVACTPKPRRKGERK